MKTTLKQSCTIFALCLLSPLMFVSAKPAAPAGADIQSPAGPGSAEANLALGPDGRVYLTWIEPADGGNGSILYFSSLGSQKWSAPKPIARSSNWFVNAADFPSLSVLKDGTLCAPRTGSIFP